jgi:hypothetical protein
MSASFNRQLGFEILPVKNQSVCNSPVFFFSFSYKKMSFMMDRATEAAASNLAEVRKLIESMTALVSSQQQQQQQQQLLQKQKELQFEQQQQEKEQAKQEKKDIPPIQQQQQQQQQQKQQQKEPQLSTTTPLPQSTMQNWSSNTNSNNLYSSR